MFRKKGDGLEKILLVDDVKLLLEMQKSMLASSRLNIFTAEDGIEALSIARSQMPNLIVMDNHMPNMDGLTCCREIKADPLLKGIPVIMLTNAVREEDCKLYLSAGAVAVLSKPIDARLYLLTLKKYLSAVECRGVRVPLATEVKLNAGTALVPGITKDVSVKGIHITSEFEPSPSEEVRFSFTLPGSDTPTEVRGKVAWVRKKRVGVKVGCDFEFGVEFMEITGKGLPFIRKRELEAFVSLHSDNAV